MTAEERVTTIALGMSVCLHLGILVVAPLWPRQITPPEKHRLTRTVMQFQQPAPFPQPSVSPAMPIPPQPLTPLTPPTPVQPRTPQIVAHQQHLQLPTPVPEVAQPPVPPVEVQVTTAPTPRKPVSPGRHATVLPPAAVPVVPEVTPQLVLLQITQMPNQAEPKRPSDNWQHTTVARQQPTTTLEIDPVKEYLALVLAELERYKYYPQQARRRGLQGQVMLQFVILPNGQVIDPRITDSSGHSPFASAALTALRRASPLPPFPPEVKQNRLLVEVPISYELTER